MSGEQYPSIDYLRQCVRYEDGKVFWLVRPREHFSGEGSWKSFNTQYAGKEAGFIIINRRDRRSRWMVGIRGHDIFRHLIVWALHAGEWHLGIDHKDRDSLNDRIENLRPADGSQNGANSILRSDNRSGFKGVSWHDKMSKWQTHVCVRGKYMHIGYFDDPAAAHVAYLAAVREHFGEFAYGG